MKPNKSKPIPITGPSITNLEVRFVTEAVRHGWFENHSKYIEQFEREFAKYIGVKYAIATSSCHGALHLGLLGLAIKRGNEVIMPDVTWSATAAVVRYVGAKPVFVDIHPQTWCIDPDKIEKAITKRTRAIMAVTLYGHPPAMKEIMEIAKKHRLYIIEDAAQSVGSEYYGKRPGSFGDYAAYSFHGTKIMTTAEGGIFVTNNKNLFEKVYSLSNIGKHPKRPFWVERMGYKYKMTNMQAALGLAQLKRIEALVARKRQIFNWYKERLQNVNGITLNVELPHCYNNYWMPAIIFDKSYKLKKEEIVQRLEKFSIIARPFFYPLSLMPPYKTKVNNPVAYNVSAHGISPPCSHVITKEQVNYVCDSLLKILKI